MWEDQRVSVVLPAYNEAANIAIAVRDFAAVSVVDEVLVVDNNSRDETAALAAEAGARVIHESQQGYGFALRRGMREASGDLVILAEPDGTFVARDVLKPLVYAEDFDMVLGTRTTRELIWRQANMGWPIRVGNLLVAKLLQFLFDGPSLSDCGCTLRLIRRQTLELLLPRLTVGGSHLLPEMVILALLLRLRVIEVPVNYRGRVGESKIHRLAGDGVPGGPADDPADPALPRTHARSAAERAVVRRVRILRPSEPAIPLLLLGLVYVGLAWPQLGLPLIYDDVNFAFAAEAVARTGLPFANAGYMSDRWDFCATLPVGALAPAAVHLPAWAAGEALRHRQAGPARARRGVQPDSGVLTYLLAGPSRRSVAGAPTPSGCWPRRSTCSARWRSRAA